MAKTKRSWDLLSDDARKASIDNLIDFFGSEYGDSIGVIKAEAILDHILQTAGVQMYNKGIEDSLDFLDERWESIKLDLSSLLKRSLP